MNAISSTALRYLLFPALTIVWRVSSPLIGHVLPLNQQVVHVHSGRGIEYNATTQYPIIDFIGLVEQHGYDAEEHNVTTSDGYILRLHRISGGPKSPKAPCKPVVYLQHSIGMSSDSWVLIGPNNDLAFLLVDAGYDVWVGNTRGNAYSRGHVSKNPKCASYWDFSYHEIGVYDVPALTDTILNKTGAKNLTYFGVSTGSSLSYILLSMLPEYNNKFNLVYSAAPTGYWGRELAYGANSVDRIADYLREFIKYFQINELGSQKAAVAYIGNKYCSDDNIIFQPLCANLFCKIGLDCSRFNRTALPEILAHFPAGISAKTFDHYLQFIRKRSFEAYDHGTIKNMIKYGQKNPPIYNLKNIRAPISMWYGQGDDFLNPKDVVILSKMLPNVVSLKAVENKNFNHYDFLWAKDARKLVYDRLPLLKRTSEQNKPTKQNEPTEQNRPRQQIEPNEQNQSTQQTEPMKRNEPTESNRPRQQIQPKEQNQPTQQNEPMKRNEPTEPNRPRQQIKPNEQNKPTQQNEASEQNKPTEKNESSERNEPAAQIERSQQNEPSEQDQVNIQVESPATTPNTLSFE